MDIEFNRMIREVAAQFVGRLDAAIIKSAVDYVDFNEDALAVHILCEQLFEYDINITQTEFQTLSFLANATGVEGDVGRMLKKLVR